ncbi:Pnap_2097 family protein [Azohydromonas lata]|uniref:Pnap_2097 family protein n=1 Tax=Azohydromonas lata TaxID=45677 RepID=UPI00083173CE|nr:Pnap_2097 family protein [Azohydromonas lata]
MRTDSTWAATGERGGTPGPAQSARDTAELLVGMPQLNSLGLSENWLLKEAGHRHWQHLAAGLGCRPGELRDAQGRRVYAAFTQVHLREARLQDVQEDQPLRWHLDGTRVGRSRHYSRHLLVGADGALARLEMLSAFVARQREGDNHSVLRVPMAAGAGTPDPAIAEEAAACAEGARAVRAGAWLERFALDAHAQPLAAQALRPCPSNDFNGAGLLYFASFQALADRAHWAWGLADGQASVRERQMVFHGNVNVGEMLELRLLARRAAGRGHWSWTQVCRGGDGRVIADIATHWAP